AEHRPALRRVRDPAHVPPNRSAQRIATRSRAGDRPAPAWRAKGAREREAWEAVESRDLSVGGSGGSPRHIYHQARLVGKLEAKDGLPGLDPTRAHADTHEARSFVAPAGLGGLASVVWHRPFSKVDRASGSRLVAIIGA